VLLGTDSGIYCLQQRLCARGWRRPGTWRFRNGDPTSSALDGKGPHRSAWAAETDGVYNRRPLLKKVAGTRRPGLHHWHRRRGLPVSPGDIRRLGIALGKDIAVSPQGQVGIIGTE